MLKKHNWMRPYKNSKDQQNLEQVKTVRMPAKI